MEPGRSYCVGDLKRDDIGTTVLENADDDILTKQYFHRAHTEERRELETGLIVVRANGGQW
jgi:hypothetical protein